MPAGGQQIIRGFWSPASRQIEFLLGQFEAAPGFSDGIDKGPGRLHLVTPNEQRGVTRQRFEQEPFVGFGCISAELGIVTEVHSNWTQLQTGSGNFSIETKRNSFVGLQSKCDGV